MKSVIRRAFEATCDGFSVDRVVADPDLNSAFLGACRASQLTASDEQLNHFLLNLRKSGGLSGIKSRRTDFEDLDEFRFAAEMAIRFLERKSGSTLDRILCNPDLASEFDQLASSIAPGFSSLKYRWAALNLRKKNQLKPELLSKIVEVVSVHEMQFANLDWEKVPTVAGLYLIASRQEYLYAGESENLRKRLSKHFEHSDNKFLARWIWEQGYEAVRVEFHILPHGTSTKVRRALESELIRSRQPAFNVKR